jgi:LysR family nitrogen assimilation transcriptional regulator
MDVRQLRYFVSIVDAGSLSKAAQKLFIAQPSLSQQIAGLEIELKTKLLLRSAQGVMPTTAGSVLYRHARLVLRQMEQIRADVRDDSGGEAGTVAVGLPTSIAAILATPLFMRIRERFPAIRLQIFESMSGYIGEMLPQGRLDLALLFRDTETRGMSIIPLFDEELCLLGHAGLGLGGEAVECSLATLTDVPLVLPSVPSGLRLIIERSFQSEDIALNIVADIDSLLTLLAIANAGAACTILPASALAQ